MHVEQIRDFALSLGDVEESMPFGPGNVVFKIQSKMFLLLALDADPLQFNVKCDPDKAVQLRDQYTSVLPGYHMNKKHWNTIVVDGELTDELIKKMIQDSFQLVYKKKNSG